MKLSQSEIAGLYLAALILGIALGLFLDLLRMPRRLFGWERSVGGTQTVSPLRKRRFGRIVVFLEDFLFCMVAAIAMILLFYERNNGKVRPVAFLVTLAGFVFYRVTLGRLTDRLLGVVSVLLHRAVRAVKRPLRRAASRIRNRFGRLCAIGAEKIRRRQRKHYTAMLGRLAETTALGLLPDGCVLKETKENKHRDPAGGRKDKQRKQHGGKEKNAKDHRTEQKSMA